MHACMHACNAHTGQCRPASAREGSRAHPARLTIREALEQGESQYPHAPLLPGLPPATRRPRPRAPPGSAARSLATCPRAANAASAFASAFASANANANAATRARAARAPGCAAAHAGSGGRGQVGRCAEPPARAPAHPWHCQARPGLGLSLHLRGAAGGRGGASSRAPGPGAHAESPARLPGSLEGVQWARSAGRLASGDPLLRLLLLVLLPSLWPLGCSAVLKRPPRKWRRAGGRSPGARTRATTAPLRTGARLHFSAAL